MVESHLSEQIGKVLGLSSAKLAKLGIHQPLNTLGLDSLMAVELKNRIKADLGVTVSVMELLKGPSIALLATQVVEQLASPEPAPAPELPPLAADPTASAASAPEYLLSFAQRRLWFLDQLDPGSVADTVPLALRMAGRLDGGALRAALNEIVRRHETLRTTFVAAAGSPLPVVAPPLDVALPTVDLSGVAEEEREAEMQRQATTEVRVPFDLSRGPLFRARLLRMAADEQVLVLTMHHIASDGWSLAVFLSELVALYTAFSRGEPSPLPDLPFQFADYAHWQRRLLDGELLDRQLAYWREQLAGAPTLLELPTDRPRPPVQTYRGAHHRFTLPTHVVGRPPCPEPARRRDALHDTRRRARHAPLPVYGAGRHRRGLGYRWAITA